MKILNLSIAILLIFTIGCSQNSGEWSSAEMTFKDDIVFDFGKIEHQSDGRHDFVFKNTGKDPLIITNVKSSCGCTVPTYPQSPVKKGETGIINVKYDTNRLGSWIFSFSFLYTIINGGRDEFNGNNKWSQWLSCEPNGREAFLIYNISRRNYGAIWKIISRKSRWCFKHH